MTKYKIGVIGGDGIGPEVVREALRVLQVTKVDFDTLEFDLGATAYLKTGKVLPEEDLEKMRALDAILLGAVGAPLGSKKIPTGLLERNLLLRLRFELDLYINLRPFKAPTNSLAKGADFVIVRENTEGAYVNEGGFFKKFTEDEVALQGSINTKKGIKRCCNFAFKLALERNSKVTLVHKTNVLSYAGDLWQRTFDEVGANYPQVETNYNHVDASCIYLVEKPEIYDVIVTDNLFGDIITDLAGALCGGIGAAASGNINPEKSSPSMFEPVHGAAYDIAGKNIANPLGAIRSVALMLEFLGETELARRLEKTVSEVSEEISRVPTELKTSEITNLVIERMV